MNIKELFRMKTTILLLCFGFTAAQPNEDMSSTQIHQTLIDPAPGAVNNGIRTPDAPSVMSPPFHGTKDIRPEMQPMVQPGDHDIMTLNGPMHPDMPMVQPGIAVSLECTNISSL